MWDTRNGMLGRKPAAIQSPPSSRSHLFCCRAAAAARRRRGPLSALTILTALLAAACRCWLLLVDSGFYWLLLAATGCCWLLLIATDCDWLLVLHLAAGTESSSLLARYQLLCIFITTSSLAFVHLQHH